MILRFFLGCLGSRWGGGGFGVTRPVAEYRVEDVGVSSGQDIMA